MYKSSGDSNRVPLCDMALETVEQAKAYSDGTHVFRSSYKDGRPMTPHALSRAIARHWKEIGFDAKWTPHDLRRTLRTRLAEISVSDIIAERVMGHKLQGMLGVYNRHGYDAEKRDALTKWEARLKEILGIEKPVSNVIDMGVHRGGR